ncbi:MAG: tRNA threonylcarbamoyladenosine dehydratase [Clostridia bacterium]|nr:tRNA threonylcarbamoyladenosine dehydratase [Clostridia bacterium]
MIPEWLEREVSLIGEEAVSKLAASSVFVAGAGGVGGFVIEGLARAGVGRIIVADHDTVAPSNINRQIIATSETVGRYKAELAAERIRSINPACEAISLPVFLTAENIGGIFDEYKPDIIADAIDCVTSKADMICAAKERGIYIVSCMGTGNKLDPTRFRIADIYKTEVCPLARAMRTILRKRGIDSVDVLYSSEPPVNTGRRTPASISFVPSCAGLMIAGHCIKKLSGVG